MSSPPLREKRDVVLLVDDDPVARVLTASVLESHGLSVADVESGEAALECFETVRPACVILDALMPGLDGFNTCVQLRKMNGGAHVPVLILTGLEDEESVARAYEAGATDFFVKSQQWTLLAQRVRYLLRSSRMRGELEKSRARLTKAQALARLGSWEWDLRTRSIQASAEVFRLLGLPPREHMIEEAELLMHVLPEDRELLLDSVRQVALQGRIKTSEIRLRHAQGHVITVHCEGEPDGVENGRVMRVSGTLQDISQRKEAELQIRALASYDVLTQLPNRRMFGDRFADGLHQARARKERMALLFIDLDRFKHINDTQGHVGGDAMLVDVAQRLMSCVRQRPTTRRESDLVARLGGDEFVVLLHDLKDDSDAEIVAERILESLRRPFVIRGTDNYISACIGVSHFPRHGAEADTLMQAADAAMYAVKSDGRNGHRTFSPEMTTEARRRWAIETDLHKALERGEFVLYYQPQVDVRTGRMIGAEALIRWNRDGKLIPPGEFIAIAQECGLIIPMGDWAIGEATRQIREWQDAGHRELRVAVNVSSSHFTRGDLVGSLRAATELHGVDPSLIEIEITETVLMTDLVQTTETLLELTNFGVKLSIDDFGTGYSSLAYLKRFPISALKIDRSFVHDLASGSDNEAIVAAIVAMANTLQLDVIAEGVETPEEATLLHRAGCHDMQGFWFARPLPAEAFTELLKREATDEGHEPWMQPARSNVVPLIRNQRA
ncbi:EAL domain-containing protein [soil metagenome]